MLLHCCCCCGAGCNVRSTWCCCHARRDVASFQAMHNPPPPLCCCRGAATRGPAVTHGPRLCVNPSLPTPCLHYFWRHHDVTHVAGVYVEDSRWRHYAADVEPSHDSVPTPSYTTTTTPATSSLLVVVLYHIVAATMATKFGTKWAITRNSCNRLGYCKTKSEVQYLCNWSPVGKQYFSDKTANINVQNISLYTC